MGRVSKHKRIKACDPFYKGPRRIDPRNNDLPPEAPDDQPMPKTLSRLLKSGQQITQTSKPKRLKQINSQTEHATPGSQESELTRRRRRKGQIEKVNGGNGGSVTKGVERREQPMFKRQKGESLKAYLERIDVESNARIMEAFRRSRKQSNRRKRYYEKRRRRLKGLKEEEELDETAQVVEFDDLKDKVYFGETVQEPPRLAARPRGSVKEMRKNKAHSLLLMNTLESSERKSKLKVGVATGKVGGLKRQRDIEIERERAIEQYRQIKKTRTKHTI